MALQRERRMLVEREIANPAADWRWAMTLAPAPRTVFTTTEFERWWEAQGCVVAAEAGLDPSAARALGWIAWRAGREQMNEATAHQRLQPVRR